MSKNVASAKEIRDELNRVALRLSADSEGTKIELMRPTPAGSPDPSCNWDVEANCPEGLDDFAMRAVEDVAARYDLTE